MKVEINISRLEHLLNLYNLAEEEFLSLISKGLKKPVTYNQIFSKAIDLNHLKRIDKIFHKGLSFYADPSDPSTSKATSIFYRKSEFNSELNLKARKIVNEFEELKISLSAIATLTDINQKRELPILTIKSDPKIQANKFRDTIRYSFLRRQKDFLKSLINKLAEHNILVFEFVETWNQKERANIDGVYLNPNVIVLKRLDGASYKREIFTLAHEVGHYLLNIEEIEKIDYEILAKKNIDSIEEWCNDFAFYFLLGEYNDSFEQLSFATPKNDYYHNEIKIISDKTHLSRLALFTKLLFNKKIKHSDYLKIKSELNKEAKDYFDNQKRILEAEKEANPDKQFGGAKKPIQSDLLISTIQAAFYEGVINEMEVCKTLKIQPSKLGNYIQW